MDLMILQIQNYFLCITSNNYIDCVYVQIQIIQQSIFYIFIDENMISVKDRIKNLENTKKQQQQTHNVLFNKSETNKPQEAKVVYTDPRLEIQQESVSVTNRKEVWEKFFQKKKQEKQKQVNIVLPKMFQLKNYTGGIDNMFNKSILQLFKNSPRISYEELHQHLSDSEIQKIMSNGILSGLSQQSHQTQKTRQSEKVNSEISQNIKTQSAKMFDSQDKQNNISQQPQRFNSNDKEISTIPNPQQISNVPHIPFQKTQSTYILPNNQSTQQKQIQIKKHLSQQEHEIDFDDLLQSGNVDQQQFNPRHTNSHLSKKTEQFNVDFNFQNEIKEEKEEQLKLDSISFKKKQNKISEQQEEDQKQLLESVLKHTQSNTSTGDLVIIPSGNGDLQMNGNLYQRVKDIIGQELMFLVYKESATNSDQIEERCQELINNLFPDKLQDPRQIKLLPVLLIKSIFYLNQTELPSTIKELDNSQVIILKKKILSNNNSTIKE